MHQDLTIKHFPIQKEYNYKTSFFHIMKRDRHIIPLKTHFRQLSTVAWSISISFCASLYVNLEIYIVLKSINLVEYNLSEKRITHIENVFTTIPINKGLTS